MSITVDSTERGPSWMVESDTANDTLDRAVALVLAEGMA